MSERLFDLERRVAIIEDALAGRPFYEAAKAAAPTEASPEPGVGNRCGECDPSFGCFGDSFEPCQKQPAMAAEGLTRKHALTCAYWLCKKQHEHGPCCNCRPTPPESEEG